jgi:hypothetical protein
MSTRCNILLKDAYGDEMWFFRHGDGEPETVMPDLKRFMGWVKNNHIRSNVSQAGGWIVVMGLPPLDGLTGGLTPEIPRNDPYSPWKVGRYEPAVRQGGDIDWLYTLDLGAKTITKEKVS